MKYLLAWRMPVAKDLFLRQEVSVQETVVHAVVVRRSPPWSAVEAAATDYTTQACVFAN